MNISDFFKNLQLDTWYKAFMYVGGLALVFSFFFDVKGITNSQLQLLAGGIFFLGIGEWKNHKKELFIKPPNVYTGPPALVTYSVRKPDLFGIFLDLLGVVLIGLAIWSIASSIPPTRPLLVTPTVTATPSITPTP